MIRGDNVKHTLIVILLFAALGVSEILVLDTFLDIAQLLTFIPLGIMLVLLLMIGIILPGFLETYPKSTGFLLFVFDAFLVFGVIGSIVLILLVQATIPGSLLVLYALRFLSSTGGLALLGLYGRDLILNK